MMLGRNVTGEGSCPMMGERAADGGGQKQYENQSGMPEGRDGPSGLRGFVCGDVAAEGAHGRSIAAGFGPCYLHTLAMRSNAGHGKLEVSVWKKWSLSPRFAHLRENFRDRCPVSARCSWGRWRCAKRCGVLALRRNRSTSASWAMLSPPDWD